MKTNSIKSIGKSDFVNMGPIVLRQPLPTASLKMADPFVLLHHYGPYNIDETNNPFDLGPHPHRGFEPITFLIQGEQLHRDSLGHESVVRAGDVQWTTAGRGIIHAEGPTDAFVKKGGTLEGIQLWLNLPASKKMMPANYQHATHQSFRVVVSNDEKVTTRIVAGHLNDIHGRIGTQTPVNAYLIEGKVGGELKLPLEPTHDSMLYLITGEVTVNETTKLKLNENQLLCFNRDGEGITLKFNTSSKLLFLSGEPINEPVANWGPYVMNNQTEIMEALRDYQQGKMGFLPV